MDQSKSQKFLPKEDITQTSAHIGLAAEVSSIFVHVLEQRTNQWLFHSTDIQRTMQSVTWSLALLSDWQLSHKLLPIQELPVSLQP